MDYFSNKFGVFNKNPNFAFPFGRTTREFSSAGSEHLPYKQRVGGSNPSTPTKSLEEIRGFFYAQKSVFTGRHRDDWRDCRLSQTLNCQKVF